MHITSLNKMGEHHVIGARGNGRPAAELNAIVDAIERWEWYWNKVATENRDIAVVTFQPLAHGAQESFECANESAIPGATARLEKFFDTYFLKPGSQTKSADFK